MVQIADSPLQTLAISLDAFTDEQIDFLLKESQRVYYQLARAHQSKVPATLTVREWIAIIAQHNGLCAYCRQRPFEHMEHVLPIIAGGGTTAENCVPACKRCNSHKCAHGGIRDEKGNLSIAPENAVLRISTKATKDTAVPSYSQEPFLTPKDLSKLGPLSSEAIISHIKAGDLEGIQLGNHYYARLSVFTTWLEKRDEAE